MSDSDCIERKNLSPGDAPSFAILTEAFGWMFRFGVGVQPSQSARSDGGWWTKREKYPASWLARTIVPSLGLKCSQRSIAEVVGSHVERACRKSWYFSFSVRRPIDGMLVFIGEVDGTDSLSIGNMGN